MQELLTIGTPIAVALVAAIVALWRQGCTNAKAIAKLQEQRVNETKAFAMALQESTQQVTAALRDSTDALRGSTEAHREHARLLKGLIVEIQQCPYRQHSGDGLHPHPAPDIDTDTLLRRK